MKCIFEACRYDPKRLLAAPKQYRKEMRMPVETAEMDQTDGLSDALAPIATSKISTSLRVAAVLSRTLFICMLVVVTLRVSMPQSETIWSSYETPPDLIRVLVGLIASLWLVAQLFRAPQDVDGCRTWLYLGLAAIPIALACLLVVW